MNGFRNFFPRSCKVVSAGISQIPVVRIPAAHSQDTRLNLTCLYAEANKTKALDKVGKRPISLSTVQAPFILYRSPLGRRIIIRQTESSAVTISSTSLFRYRLNLCFAKDLLVCHNNACRAEMIAPLKTLPTAGGSFLKKSSKYFFVILMPSHAEAISAIRNS